MKGTKPVPVDITVTYSDGSTKKVHRSIAVWEKGNTSVIVQLPAGKIKVLRWAMYIRRILIKR